MSLARVSTASGEEFAGRTLPVRPELRAVLPWPGLRRGATIALRGSTSLLFAILASATTEGSWAAVVGLPGLSVLAAAEAGVAVQRMALVPRPGTQLGEVVAALTDGLDLVAFTGTTMINTAQTRTLAARVRQRGTVLLPLGPWPSPDVELRCANGRWYGVTTGNGHLRYREVEVHATGRGAAARPRSIRICMPGPGGPTTRSTG
ncbi:hypothetical protein [Allokutzneria albata]|uniref:Protein RecA n=1 Tax=Allokutzneria albata TaxID=211114 RepID=A0A1G9SDT8_ALLAB|nr:hypothetical protein [Allokutzneria albata]SDM33477.1 hypothetical protein SAMN04489726_1089 [Allokutzneria albata]